MSVTDVIRLRPHSRLISQGLIATVAFLAPVFLVLYYLTTPDGPWWGVVFLQLVASAIVGIAASRFFLAGIWVDPTGISERGFFRRMTRFEAADVGSMVSATMVDASGPLGSPQLFVCDHEGRQLVRMRGRFWSLAAMDTVTRTLNATHVRLDDPMSTREIHERFPGVGYWFERRPVLAALIFVATIVATGIASFSISMLVGPLPRD
jgi:hypothetical protein